MGWEGLKPLQRQLNKVPDPSAYSVALQSNLVPPKLETLNHTHHGAIVEDLGEGIYNLLFILDMEYWGDRYILNRLILTTYHLGNLVSGYN